MCLNMNQSLHENYKKQEHTRLFLDFVDQVRAKIVILKNAFVVLPILPSGASSSSGETFAEKILAGVYLVFFYFSRKVLKHNQSKKFRP